MTTSCSELLRDWVGGSHARGYWHRREIISQDAFNLVDWDSVQKILSADSVLFRMWWAKHLTGFCAIGLQMSRWGEWDSPRCPCCEQVAETSTRHMWACTHPEMYVF